MAKRILVPVDDGIGAEAVVPFVAAAARERGATVRLLRVYPVPRPLHGRLGRMVASPDLQMARASDRAADEVRALVETALREVDVESVVRFGDPVEEILLEADAFDADMIAVGGERAGLLRRMLAPPVAERVLRRSPVPVLFLRT